MPKMGYLFTIKGIKGFPCTPWGFVLLVLYPDVQDDIQRVPQASRLHVPAMPFK